MCMTLPLPAPLGRASVTYKRNLCLRWPGFPDVRKLGVSKFRTFRKSEGTDRLLLNIDVDADLAPAFNWNVKQLFAFVVAEYETETNPVNQVSQLISVHDYFGFF